MSSQAGLEITVPIAQTIRVSAIQGKNFIILYIVDCELTMALKVSSNLVPSYRASNN